MGTSDAIKTITLEVLSQNRLALNATFWTYRASEAPWYILLISTSKGDCKMKGILDVLCRAREAGSPVKPVTRALTRHSHETLYLRWAVP